MKKDRGFTLVEIMVVVLIIGILSAIAIANFGKAKATARDARRVADMKALISAIEMFSNNYNHYPGNTFEGVSNSGEMIGDDKGPIEQALAPFLRTVPKDPLHDGINYFYSYDPQHSTPDGMGAVLAFNKAETDTVSLIKDTSQGGDMNQNNADYNIAFYPPGP